MKKVLLTFAAATALSAAAATVAPAASVNIVSDNPNSTENLGSFEGSLNYDSSLSLLTVVLKNTTSGATAARLTGFVFNIGGNASATFIDSDDLSTGGVNESAFNNTGSESAAPFGTFEAGAALGGDFLGGGSPNSGIAIGDTGIFKFNVAGPDASSLDTLDFFTTDGGNTSYAFAVRFKGINPGGKSDKVPAKIVGGNPPPPPPPAVPLPPAVWSGLATMALSGAYFGRQRLKALLA